MLIRRIGITIVTSSFFTMATSSIVKGNYDDGPGIYNPRNKDPNVFTRRVMNFLNSEGADILNGNCWMLVFIQDVKDKRKQLTYKKPSMGSVVWQKMAADC